MSEFLLVVPEGWSQLDWQVITNSVPGMDYGGTMNMINSNNYADMNDKLKEAGIIPADYSIAEARLIDDTYFLVRLG
jgi:hypothetical protein